MVKVGRAPTLAKIPGSSFLGIAIGIAGPPDPDFARQLDRRLLLLPVLFMYASGAQLDEITKLIDSEDLRPIVDRTYPFDQAPQALAQVEGGRSKGKVVITMH